MYIYIIYTSYYITLHNYSFFWGRPTLIHPHPFETPSYSRYCAKASSLVSAALCATAWCTSRRRSSLGGIAVRKRCHIFTWETKGASPRELYNWDVIDRNMIFIYIYIYIDIWHIYIYMYIDICIYIYIYVYWCIYYMYICIIYIYIYLTYIYIYIYIYWHIYIYILTYIYIYWHII